MNDVKINLQYTTIKDPLPDFIYEGLKNFSAGANAYRPQPVELVERLAAKYNLPKEMIYLTAGIDEAIQMFAKAYGQNAFVFTPTYIVYSDVEEFGGKLTSLFSLEGTEFKIKSDTIPDASLIFLANPNNPSGVTSREEVMKLVKNNPQAKVVIDEAYGEYAGLSVIDQIKDNPNMTVFRSFSKAYGMAGNRIGYIISHPETINVVKNKSQWANVSYLSVGAALTAMDHEDYFVAMRQDINTRRDEFMKFLVKSGFSIIPSQINAIVIKFANETEGTKFAEFLTQSNFVITHGNGASNIGLDKSYVRIAMGNRSQMDKLAETITKYDK